MKKFRVYLDSQKQPAYFWQESVAAVIGRCQFLGLTALAVEEVAE
jgi:hypothetical protein